MKENCDRLLIDLVNDFNAFHPFDEQEIARYYYGLTIFREILRFKCTYIVQYFKTHSWANRIIPLAIGCVHNTSIIRMEGGDQNNCMDNSLFLRDMSKQKDKVHASFCFLQKDPTDKWTMNQVRTFAFHMLKNNKGR